MAHLQATLTPARHLLRALPSFRVKTASLPTFHAGQRTLRRRFATLNQPAPTRTFQEPDRLADFTRDEQIDTVVVQVKNADGRLEEPQRLRKVLQNIDRESHCVVQLSKVGERDVAVVQIREKMDLLKQVRERENQMRQLERAKQEKKPKQIELNWAISENDLTLKIKQMEGFLEKGKTVEVLLAAKRRQRKASEEEGSAVLKRIKQALQEMGAKEIKPMQGQVLKQATMIVKK